MNVLKMLTSFLAFLSLFHFITEAREADLVLLHDSGEAVCLDGSPPGYYYRQGKAAIT